MQVETLEELGRFEKFSDDSQSRTLVRGPGKGSPMVEILLLNDCRVIRHIFDVSHNQREQLDKELILVAYILWIDFHVLFELWHPALLRVLHHLFHGLLFFVLRSARGLRRQSCLLRGRILLLFGLLGVFSWPVGEQPVNLKHIVKGFPLVLLVSLLHRLLSALHVGHLSLLFLLR